MNLHLLFSAVLVRIGLIMYGTYHDDVMEVKFTDVDYTVFTEAAEYITSGHSPYLKDTYKYTPALAYLLTPNIYLHVLFGKFLFCAVDLLVAVVMLRILDELKICKGDLLVGLFWLFNPFTMTISSRGNAESIQLFLVLTSMYLHIKKRYLLSAIALGFSVHFKLYPVIYLLPYALNIAYTKMRLATFYGEIKFLPSILLNVSVIGFGLVFIATFILSGLVMFIRYGDEFIENTYLFHLSRVDDKHNFSVYFYILKLARSSPWLPLINKAAFLPQLFVVVWCGYTYAENLPVAAFLQTFAFVALNKVSTSQYFVWYIGLLPLAYPYFVMPTKKCVCLVVSWLLGQMVWLSFAYLLEFKKRHVELYVWLASCLFLCINLVVMYHITKHAKKSKPNGVVTKQRKIK